MDTTLSISRIQNRRGKRVDLPQPLAPGELGLCTDTNQLFIGRDPADVASGVYLLSEGQISTVNTFLAEGFITASSSALVDTDIEDIAIGIKTAIIDNAISLGVPWHPNILEMDLSEVFQVADPDNTLIIAVKSVSGVQNLTDAQAAAESYLSGLASVTGTALGARDANDSSIVLVNDQAVGESHDRANAVAAGVNFISAAGLLTSNLNLEILTGFGTLITEPPNDFLATPIEIDLNSNVITGVSGDISFVANYDSGLNQVSISYNHDFPEPVKLKVTTKRWSKF